MSRKSVKPRPAWEERFELPSHDALLAAFNRQQRQLVDLLRTRLLASGAVDESLGWRGIPWRWSFAYSLEGESDRPWAYLIPQPGRPLFALPIPAESIEELPLRKLSRSVRDALAIATKVGETYWPQWELTGKQQVEELLLLALRRRELLLTPA